MLSWLVGLPLEVLLLEQELGHGEIDQCVTIGMAVATSAVTGYDAPHVHPGQHQPQRQDRAP